MADLVATKQNVLSSNVSRAKARAAAISGWQLIREMLTAPNIESDEALAARMVFLEEIVMEVGVERFHAAIREVVRTKKNRYEVSVAYIRECAGLSLALPANPAVVAWETVTDVIKNHVGRDPNGALTMRTKVTIDLSSGRPVSVIKPVPEITPDVQRVVDLMGGWGAMAEAHPAWWAQRYQMFCQLYREGASPTKALVRVQA